MEITWMLLTSMGTQQAAAGLREGKQKDSKWEIWVKKLPKEAVEKEGVEAPGEGCGEQDGQEMPGGSGVGNGHPEASSRFISHPAH